MRGLTVILAAELILCRPTSPTHSRMRVCACRPLRWTSQGPFTCATTGSRLIGVLLVPAHCADVLSIRRAGRPVTCIGWALGPQRLRGDLRWSGSRPHWRYRQVHRRVRDALEHDFAKVEDQRPVLSHIVQQGDTIIVSDRLWLSVAVDLPVPRTAFVYRVRNPSAQPAESDDGGRSWR